MPKIEYCVWGLVKTLHLMHNGAPRVDALIGEFFTPALRMRILPKEKKEDVRRVIRNNV